MNEYEDTSYSSSDHCDFVLSTPLKQSWEEYSTVMTGLPPKGMVWMKRAFFSGMWVAFNKAKAIISAPHIPSKDKVEKISELDVEIEEFKKEVFQFCPGDDE